jgi:hypothetical protein
MARKRRKHPYCALFAPVLLAGAYRVWFYFEITLTGSYRLDGLTGVILGLYICSQAAANLLDLLLYSGLEWEHENPGAGLTWLSANILTLLIGFSLIFFATKQFFR